ARSDDGSLAGLLAVRDFDDRTLAWDATLEKNVAALTTQQIQEALRRHLDLQQLSVVKAGDFQKAATAGKENLAAPSLSAEPRFVGREAGRRYGRARAEFRPVGSRMEAPRTGHRIRPEQL